VAKKKGPSETWNGAHSQGEEKKKRRAKLGRGHRISNSFGKKEEPGSKRKCRNAIPVGREGVNTEQSEPEPRKKGCMDRKGKKTNGK